MCVWDNDTAQTRHVENESSISVVVAAAGVTGPGEERSGLHDDCVAYFIPETHIQRHSVGQRAAAAAAAANGGVVVLCVCVRALSGVDAWNSGTSARSSSLSSANMEAPSTEGSSGRGE